MSLRYVALGDSVAAGYRAAPGQDYVSLIRSHLRHKDPGWRGIRLASPGAVTRDLRAQAAQAARLRPRLITIDIGGNDLRRALPDPPRAIPRAMANLDRALHTLRQETSARIFIADVYNPYPRKTRIYRLADGWIDEFNSELRKAAGRWGVHVVPIKGALAHSSAKVFSSDRLHPNTLGHEVIAQAFIRNGAG